MANNIIKRVWNQNRMVNIEDLYGMAFQAEAGGHTFQIFGVDDTGAAVPLSGTVAGVFRRPDNADIALTGASTGGVASVTLTEDCYAVPGRFGLTIFVTSDGQKTAVYAAVGTVAVTSGGGVAGDTPQDVVDLINAIAAAVATIPASYTDLMTSIAPVYSSSALYPLGAYSWYDGHLYRCTTPITTAETWTAAHWTAATMGNDVSDMKTALNTANSLSGLKWYNGYYNQSDGSFVSNIYFRMSNLIPCTAGDTFIYCGNSSQANRAVIVFFDRNGTQMERRASLGTDYTEINVVVPDGAERFRVLANANNIEGTYIVYGINANQNPISQNRERIIANEDDIAKIKSNFEYLNGIGMHFGYINKNGKIVLPSEVRKYTDYFFVPGGCTIRYKGESDHANVNGISFFDSNGAYISGDCNSGNKGTWITVTVPGNASLARISTHTNIGYKIGFEVVSGNVFDAVSNKLRSDCVAYVSGASGSDTSAADGTKELPYASIGYAISQGFRKICATPGRYNENISLSGGDFELIPWVDSQTFSDAYRPKIKLIKGTKLTVSSTGTTGIYQASFTAASGTNIYNVFVGRTVPPTSQGSLATDYNALLVEDMPDGSTPTKAAFPYQRQLYMPVLTETELSAEGTFWYDGTNNLVKFHTYDNTVAGEYYIPDDDATDGLMLNKMQKVHLEDVKVLGCYDSCVAVLNCDDVTINACEFGYCAKGMGLRLDYANARVSDCHAYAISVDGFNLHGYGYSEILNCTAFYCGDDGISHHQGCSGFVDGGEWAYCGSGGITPSFGCQVDVLNAYAHHNNIGIQWLGLQTSSRLTKMTNCLSIDNTTDIYVLWYVVTAWNCVFRTKDSQYSGLRSKLTEYGTITPA